MLEQHDAFQGESIAKSTAIETYFCTFSTIAFESERNLIRHIKTIKTRENELCCEICMWTEFLNMVQPKDIWQNDIISPNFILNLSRRCEGFVTVFSKEEKKC